MTEELTLQDLQEGQLSIHEIELLGKRAYIKELTLDDLGVVSKSELDELGQGKQMLALSLCDKDGKKLFDDVDEGVRVLGESVPVGEMLRVIQLINNINGMDVEDEEKKSEPSLSSVSA